MKTQTLLLLFAGAGLVLFARGWVRAAQLVDQELGAGEWSKARPSYKLQAAIEMMFK